MVKKNTDTVPAMLTPGEFVIKRESAKKIGYSKLNQMNKTGKVNNKKEAKMPQGKGTYGSKVGRPPKKAKGYKKGGKVKEKVDKAGQRFGHDPVGVNNTILEKEMKGEKLDAGFEAEHAKSGSYRAWKRTKKGWQEGAIKKGKKRTKAIEKAKGLKYPKSAGGSAEMQDGGKVGGRYHGYSEGGQVTSEGYPVHGGSGKYRAGE